MEIYTILYRLQCAFGVRHMCKSSFKTLLTQSTMLILYAVWESNSDNNSQKLQNSRGRKRVNAKQKKKKIERSATLRLVRYSFQCQYTNVCKFITCSLARTQKLIVVYVYLVGCIIWMIWNRYWHVEAFDGNEKLNPSANLHEFHEKRISGNQIKCHIFIMINISWLRTCAGVCV